MRTLILATLMVLLMMTTAWSAGMEEATPGEPPVIVLAIDRPDSALRDMTAQIHTFRGDRETINEDGLYFAGFIADMFRARTGAEVEVMPWDSLDGTNKAFRIALMAGVHIDVVFGLTGRMSTWAQPELALPIDEYVSAEFLAGWVPGALDIHTQGGHVYGLVGTAWCQMATVNWTLAEDVGLLHLVPSEDDTDPRWSVEDYMTIVRELPEGYWATTLFATKASGDYWQLGFLSGFGAELWKDGQIAINSPKGIQAVQWLADLREYAPPGSAGNTYAEMMGNWGAGKNFVCGGSIGYSRGLEANFENGKSDRQYQGMLINFPNMPGEVSQVQMGPDSVVAFKRTKYPQLAVELASIVVGFDAQSLRTYDGGRFPTLSAVPYPPNLNPLVGTEYQVLLNAVAKGGLMDLGMGSPHYDEIRGMWARTLQAIFLDLATVPDALAEFQDSANAIIEED